ncbi:MAG: CoA transferase [Actinomycetota bacterium]|nr:CoA transferase [Actinomycetota bacterium]
MTHTALESLLVMEIGDSVAGAYAGKLFADYGSEVHVVGEGPPIPGSSFFHTSKHRSGPGLLGEADIIIQSSTTNPIGSVYEPSHPQQIVLRISPFALSGPYATWRSTDLVDAAIAGHLRLSGSPTREPLSGVPDLVHMASGVTGFIGALAALMARARTGHGQIVETSHQEAVAALHQFSLLRYTHNGAILNRMGNRYSGPGTPIGAYECADGWIGLAISQSDQMERLLEVAGLAHLLNHEGIDTIYDVMTNQELLDGELIPYLRTQPRADLVGLFQALRLPVAPIATMEDLLTDPHLEDRDFWELDADGVRMPGPPFQISDHSWSIRPKQKHGSFSSAEEPLDRLKDGPLSGIRVLDMTRVWAGPLAARILADLGAEVLMTEVPWTRTPREVPRALVDSTHFFPEDEAGDCPWNRNGFHNKYANNKLSAVIELDKEAGRELFAALVPKVDVVIENYAPRVMPNFGLSGEALRALNPDLTYVTMPGYGRSGPNKDWVAYGPTIDGHAGHTWLTGYRNEIPWKCGIAWPDPTAGMHAAAATIVALLDRQCCGITGQTVEVAQVETAINMIGQHVVASQLGAPSSRWGNRRPGRAPQGVYPCKGEDRWIAISVVDDASWMGLCGVAGWNDLRKLDADQRWERHDELDDRLSSFTASQEDHSLMMVLQNAGVPAGAVFDAADVVNDPQLESLAFFVPLTHPEAGTHVWPRFAARLELTPATMRRAAATMGEHNEYAFLELAELSRSKYDALLEQGIVRTEPPR